MDTNRDKVHWALVTSEGVAKSIGQISQETGLDRTQVTGAIYGILHDNLGITRVDRGMYRYSSRFLPQDTEVGGPAVVTADEIREEVEEIEDLFVRIGWTDDGEPILKANVSGEVFRGVPL